MKAVLTLIAGFVLGAASMYLWRSATVTTAPVAGIALPATPANSDRAFQRETTVGAADTNSGSSPTVAPDATTDETPAGAQFNPVPRPRQGYGSSAMDEMMQLHDSRQADWQMPYWTLPRDESDARLAEDKLQYRLFNNAVAQAHPPKAMSCRSELCRIEFAFADFSAMQQFHRRWDGSALDGSHSIWSSGIGDDNGGAVFIIYAVRNETFP
ncbi:MAG: hypothetical protein ACOY3E_01375 [Pseudomonadota bacterium]